MFYATHKRSLRVVAGFAAITLPLGIALPAMAEEATDSTAIVLPAEETPTPDSPEAEGQTPAVDLLSQSTTSSGTATSSAATSITAANSHRFLLSNQWTGSINMEFAWGDAKYEVLVGDWDGDGKDTIALRKGNQFAFSNTNPASGTPKFTFTLGNASDTVLVGDWNGDGKDSIALRRGNKVFIKNSLSGSTFASTFYYGTSSDEIFVGDWDGNGTDTLAVRRGNQIHISNKNGKTDQVVSFGRASDDLYVGSFDRAKPGRDSFAVRRGNTYFINKAIKSGNADIQLEYGRTDDIALIGDWNGDGEDTLGVVRTVAAAGSAKAVPPSTTKPTGAQVLAFARTFEGKVPYVRGGKLPDGWDCIGMIRYVYQQFGATVGPKPASVLEAGRQVPYSKAKPGDLLYWPAERTMIGTNDHAGIYIDAETNFGAGRSKGTSIVQTKWRGDPPIVIRVFE